MLKIQKTTFNPLYSLKKYLEKCSKNQLTVNYFNVNVCLKEKRGIMTFGECYMMAVSQEWDRVRKLHPELLNSDKDLNYFYPVENLDTPNDFYYMDNFIENNKLSVENIIITMNKYKYDYNDKYSYY